MAPSLPSRKFAPEPFETTQKSSRDAEHVPLVRQVSPEQDRTEAPRRFAVEPVETSHVSSKDRKAEQEQKPKPRKFAVEPVETEHKSSRDRAGTQDKPKPRRFAVEPVETEHKSSKDKRQSEEKPKRRFAPQLEETSEKHSKDRKLDEQKAPHIKFSPQPVETIYRTNRKANGDEVGQQNGTAVKPRRFAPILLDTAKRSRRSGDSGPAISLADRTEFGHTLHAREHRRHIRGDKTPAEGEEGPMGEKAPDYSHALDIPSELRRQLSPMDGSAPPRRSSVTSQRSHSFRCPELDTIESSESERGSNMSSLSSSPEATGSPITASDSSYQGSGGHRHATRIRESVDENFAQYLLELESKKAQQRLLELANEAFPNSDFHEPVHHYMNRDDESDEMEIEDRPVTYDMEEEMLLEMAARRESTAKISWEQLEMQRHAEMREQERRAEKTTQKHTKQQSQSPWWNPAATYGLEMEKQDRELKDMQDRARPPMLGNDIVFPRSSSPEPARFDVTQGSTMLRNQMCYLTEHAESSRRSGDEEGLWHPRAKDTKRDATIRSGLVSPQKSTSNAKPGGLWGGFCYNDGDSSTTAAGNAGLAPPAGATGLMTPAPETQSNVNPFEQSFGTPSLAAPVGAGLKTPPTPARAVQENNINHIDGVLTAERDLDEVMAREFPDSFITQVYNYLSLGYPSLARPFDEELSKISRIPIAELRSDDKKAKQQPRGYIRLGEDFEGGGGEGVKEDEFVCMRWRALKLYVREWARQEKNMVKTDGPGGNRGTGARRGSWAI